jgi:hypothetical protein
VPNGDRAVATYARVLDGAHLWLEVDSPVNGTLSLVGPDGSAAVEGLPVSADEVSALVIDLRPLSVDHDVALSVLCVGVDGTSHPVHLSDVGRRRRTRSPATPDGRFRFYDGATDAGDVQLTRTSLTPAVQVRRVGAVESGLEVRWRTSSRTPPRVLVREPSGDVLSEVATVQSDGEVCATLRREELPPRSFSATLWVVEDTGSAAKPLRRAHDDLAHPSRAVVMPEVRTRVEGQDDVLRLTWSDDGALGVERTTEDGATG